MEIPFDIFHIGEVGGLRWCEAAPNLLAAKVRVTILGKSVPGTYLIFDQRTGAKVTVEVGAREIDLPKIRTPNNNPVPEIHGSQTAL